jgi:proteic killer suppression protein
VEVRFRTNRLKKCYEVFSLGSRAWGADVAKKYIQRIDLLQTASSLAEIRMLPGLNCHPLKGGRSGQYAITVHDRWRLVFIMTGETAEAILVEEVIQHYGD